MMNGLMSTSAKETRINCLLKVIFNAEIVVSYWLRFPLETSVLWVFRK